MAERTSPEDVEASGAAAARASLQHVHGVRPTTTAAFFDLDNTIIRGASAFHLAVGLRRRGFVRGRDVVTFAWQQARYLLVGENLKDIAVIRARALSIVAGRSVAEITAIGEEVWDEVLSLRIFPGTQAILSEHLDQGHQVWIITASPVEIGELIAARLGVTGCLGTVAEHKDGFYTGRLIGDMMHGRAKARAVEELARTEGLDLRRCYAYGDSAHDAAILSAVGHPFAINPDLRLKRTARDHGWPVHEFRGRRRAATRRGVQTASVAGLLWAARVVFRAARRTLRG
ncbi:HAD-IB family hydrolase [Actinotalea sp. AC32]|nr:HAD-IB family hydrolase [Actinotalea sp. AC32]